MGRMIRKQVYIEPEQDELLKRRSKELGISEAALIRQAIDRLGADGDESPPNRQAWEEAKRVIQERMKLPAWQEELAFINQRMQLRVPQTGRSWTREEIYEERLARYSR